MGLTVSGKTAKTLAVRRKNENNVNRLQFWTLSETVLKINYAFKRWRAHCLCPSSLVSNPKWRLADKGTDLKKRRNRASTALFHF